MTATAHLPVLVITEARSNPKILDKHSQLMALNNEEGTTTEEVIEDEVDADRPQIPTSLGARLKNH
jgi:hypothetical protein